MLKPEIIYQDDQLLVINKPPGLVVNRAESVEGKTVQDWMEATFPELFDLGGNTNSDDLALFKGRSGIAHRLDKDTSGVMLLAKTPLALLELMRQFKAREVGKTYLALIHGKLEPREGFWRLPLSRDTHNRHRFNIAPEGKVALTHYKVASHFKLPGNKYPGYEAGFSLVELYPKTGRTHQLRVHLSHLKHPILGDIHYVGRKRAKKDREWIGRQLLHAQNISLKHPGTGKPVSFSAPLPQDFTDTLKKLEPVDAPGL
jgi:23S rRNA pseudouridine1911/1915/1917 synthase